MDDREKIFLVRAQIPVIESEGFANEIRKATSGQANPTLRFSHYEVGDGIPRSLSYKIFQEFSGFKLSTRTIFLQISL